MKKLVLQMQMSVDGFVGANEDHSWQLWEWGDESAWDGALKQDFNAVFAGVDTILLSRKMAQEGYLTHWGNAAKKFPRDPFYAFAQRIVDSPRWCSATSSSNRPRSRLGSAPVWSAATCRAKSMR
ncbi:dihydrofolate reductase family protein [Mesorhizobium sp. M0243]|uniref:dihydrofolate reductase family protein n=1 Tax=Mesorhizobium sp. M0243 TaxID=2956925 RepID=UPI00333B8650